jgi:hypothetical protein
MYYDKKVSWSGEGGKLLDAIMVPPPANGDLLLRKHRLFPNVHNYKQRIHKTKRTAVDEEHLH